MRFLHMCSNRRYGCDVTEEKLALLMARSTPETLTPEEHGTRVTEASAPIPVEVRIRYSGRPEKVTAAAVAWIDGRVPRMSRM